MASIYQRGRVWWILYYEDGKKIQRSLKTKNHTDAKWHKTQIEGQIYRGASPMPDLNVPILKILDEYQAHCLGVNKAKTINDDTARIRAVIETGHIRKASDLTEDRLKAYLNGRIKEGITHTTANHTITNVKTFLNFAARKNYISGNPIARMRKFKTATLPPAYLSKGQIEAILQAAKGNSIAPMVATAIYTGMRLSEIKALAWEDIDFGRGQVTVRIAKSGKFRVIPLHPELKRILLPLKSKGRCFESTNLRRLFKKLCVKAGNIEKVKRTGARPQIVLTIGFHTFRHTFASQLVMNGIDLVTVSKLLGHSDIKTTMIYSHLSQEHINESIKRLPF